MGIFGGKVPDARSTVQVEPSKAGTANRDAVKALKERGSAIVREQHTRGGEALAADAAPRGYRGRHR